MNEMGKFVTDEARRVRMRAYGYLPEEEAYMRGDRLPPAGSVPRTTSPFLNSALFRDVFTRASLRRMGDDVELTWDIPDMLRGIADVQDWDENARLCEEERARNPEFAAWLDAREPIRFDREELARCAPGTFGAAVHEFITVSGYDMFFMQNAEPASDLEYIAKMLMNAHDLLHIISGFGPNMAGEHAVNSMNVAAVHKYFSPKFALAINKGTNFTMSTTVSRTLFNYPEGVPIMFEAMTRGIAAGQALPKPVFMFDFPSLIHRDLDELAAELGFERGPGSAWDEMDPLMLG